jgi:urease accessory protein
LPATTCTELHFVERNGRTVLAASRAELPLVVQRPLRGPGGEAALVLLTPAAALFQGDHLRLEVTCDSRVDVTLTTIGATRVNRCDASDIRVNTHVRVGAHAKFRYLPHELIPFRGADYRQLLHVDMDSEAQVWLLEVIAPGGHELLHFETEVREGGSPVLRERFTLSGDCRGQLGAYTHYGSMLLCGAAYDRAWGTAINRQLASHSPELLAGGSALPCAGIGMKALGHSAQSVREALLEGAGCPGWLRPVVGLRPTEAPR